MNRTISLVAALAFILLVGCAGNPTYGIKEGQSANVRLTNVDGKISLSEFHQDTVHVTKVDTLKASKAIARMFQSKSKCEDETAIMPQEWSCTPCTSSEATYSAPTGNVIKRALNVSESNTLNVWLTACLRY